VQSLRAFIDVPSKQACGFFCDCCWSADSTPATVGLSLRSSRSTGTNHSFKDTSCLQSARRVCLKPWSDQYPLLEC